MTRERLDGRAPRAIADPIPIDKLRELFEKTGVISVGTMNVLDRFGFMINVTKTELPQGEAIMRAIASGDLSRGVGAIPEGMYQKRKGPNQLTLIQRAELASLNIQLLNVKEALGPRKVSLETRAKPWYIKRMTKLREEDKRLREEIAARAA